MNAASVAKISVLFIFFWIILPAELKTCPLRKTTFSRRQFVGLSPTFLDEVIEVHESPPSDCFEMCRNNVNCTSYFANHYSQSCLILKGDPDIVDKHLVEDGNSGFHRKICLEDPCNHQWAFDVINGAKLFRYEDKTIFHITSVEACMEICAAEATFRCKSSWFDVRHSKCILSRHDRRSAPEIFRKTSEEVVYLERQCISEPMNCHFRARQSRSLVHQHIHVVRDAMTREECEDACLRHSQFPCRSYQFDGNPSLCLLSPEDSHSIQLGHQKLHSSLLGQPGGGRTVFEKESCIEVAVKCESTALTANVKVTSPFRGRVYAVGHPYDCYTVSITEGGQLSLSMPLHGRKCGTRNLGNGTFINSVVVQHHPFVLRTTDRKIDIACDYEEMKQKLRSAKGVRDGELKPLSHIVTAVAPTPPIRLRVVNSSDQDVSGVELGDPLFLKVELTDESIYGIFGSDLIARSSAGSETVLLIDDNGCPVEPSVIPSLDRLPGSKSLVAPFQAFKFASDAAVKFQMTVSYCLDTCPPADCSLNSGRETPQRSYGRKKRAALESNQLLSFQAGDIISDVTMESVMILVSTLKPAFDSLQTKRSWRDSDVTFLEPEGRVRVPSPPRGICISSMTLYICAALAGILQLCILLVCSFFFFCGQTSYGKASSYASASTSSISSHRKLYSQP